MSTFYIIGIALILVLICIYVVIKLIQWQPDASVLPTPSKTIIDSFKSAYNDGLDVLFNSYVCNNIRFELLPFLYFIGEKALSQIGPTPYDFSIDVSEYMRFIFPLEDEQKEIRNRINFYRKISSSGSLRGEWTIKEIGRPVLLSPYYRSLVAFGDILVNPMCANDYENSSIAINDIHELSKFSILFTNQFTVIVQRFVRELTDNQVKF